MSSGQLYRPYSSESDDSSSGSDSDDSVINNGYTTKQSLLNLPGRKKPVPTNLPAPVSETQQIPLNAGTKFETQENRTTSLFTINSRDRDTRVYPLPTYFTLRLPKVFKNIKQINLTQLNLLNSFFNFAPEKGNTFMYILEQGRTRIQNGSNVPNSVKINIRTGTYSATELVTELQFALNTVPLFDDITFDAFSSQFNASGDYTIMFNAPTPNSYNSLLKEYQTGLTKNDIVARYFQVVQTAGNVAFNVEQCKVAYYYPVIKEMIIEQPEPVPFDVTGLTIPTGFDTWYSYLVFGFTGLDDPYVQAIINLPGNIAIFENYRAQRTFNQFLVNKYTCKYDGTRGRLTIAAPSLCDSLTTDINAFYNTALNGLVASNGFTNLATFYQSYSNALNSNASLAEFYDFIQLQFSKYFGVNFAQYSALFYANTSNQINIYNTCNQYGWKLTFSADVFARQLNEFPPPTQQPIYWSNILNSFNVITDEFVSTLSVSSFGMNEMLEFPGSGPDTFGFTDTIFPVWPARYNRILFTTKCRQNISLMTIPRYLNNRGSGTDMTFPYLLQPTQTTPVPEELRFLYTPYISFFDPGYSTFYIKTDISGNPLFNMYTIQQNMFATPDYMRGLNQWLNYMTTQFVAGTRLQANNPSFGSKPTLSQVTLTSFSPFLFFQVNADGYLVSDNAHFNITFYVETQDNNLFPVPVTITWYKDRAGFMADSERDLNQFASEDNPRFYFKQQTFPTTTNSCQMVVDVNNYQTTYFKVNLENAATLPGAVPIRVFALLTGVYGDYTASTILDTYTLPYAGLPSLADQFTPASRIYQSPLNSIYDPAITQLAYDISGVSNNLLDYWILTTNSNLYDPTNIRNNIVGGANGLQYEFNQTTNGADRPNPGISSPQTWSAYFGSNTSNVLLDLYNSTNNVYLSSLQVPKPASTSNRQTLVNFFTPGQNIAPGIFTVETTTLPAPEGSLTETTQTYGLQFDTTTANPNYNSSYSIFLPCFNKAPPSIFLLTVFNLLNTDINISPTYLDLSGFCGMSLFLPPASIVKLDEVVIKFAYTQPSYDTSNLTYYDRSNSPLVLTGLSTTGALYANTQTYTNTSNSSASNWDDWYLYNRRNLKLGLFRTSQISNANVSTIELSSAITTLTLKQVTQVNNFTNDPGNLRTRQPEWGTYYTYEFSSNSQTLWDVAQLSYNSSISSLSYWRSTLVEPDIQPTYVQANISSPGFFYTVQQIYNYTYNQRGMGLAPSVGLTTYTPPPPPQINGDYYSTISTFQSDVENSFTLLPFYYDSNENKFKVSLFYGLAYTRQPSMVNPDALGAGAYWGPAGPYGWSYYGSTCIYQYNAEYQNATFPQPIYWNSKIGFEMLNSQYNPATDLSAFGNYPGIETEYQDTVMFLYANEYDTQDFVDLSTINASNLQKYWKWGQESASNYIAWDDQGGYNFLSYIYDVPVRPQVSSYAVHVRGYDPFAQFTTGIRFIGKNYTDFGRPQLIDIAYEISSIQGYEPLDDRRAWSSIYFNVSQNDLYINYTSSYIQITSTNASIAKNALISIPYANALIPFDRAFSTTRTFGRKLGYPGLTYTFSGYSNALSSYSLLQTTAASSIQFYQGIFSTATGLLNIYVTEQYSNILPSNIINRNRITDPLPFSMQFLSKTPPPYVYLPDEWGLGWNLGFKKVDTPFLVSHTSDTFIRIVQDYIYLRLNPEFNINTLGVSGKEDLSETRESRGQDQRYFSKVILSGFAQFSRAAVQLPKQFNPVLGKYETIECELVDKFGNRLSNADCDYDFVMEITEINQGPKDTASLVLPTTIKEATIVRAEQQGATATRLDTPFSIPR